MATMPLFVAALRGLAGELAAEGTPPVAAIGYSLGGLSAGVACIPDLVGTGRLAVPGIVLIASPTTLRSATRQWLRMAGEPEARVDELMERLIQLGYDAPRYDLVAQAATLPARLLIVHDIADEDVPVGDADALQAVRPDAAALRTERYGHGRILLARPVAEAVTAFVRPDLAVS